jgi:CobQ-like glutamine amidotransferase family enzyme
LGPEVAPLAQVISGYGNNGDDGGEGAVQGTVFGSYLHGPLLSKNPQLADHLLQLALRRKTDNPLLAPLNDEWERKAHQRVLKQYVHAERR